ncbi:hypothetical protein [Belnapia rosea]|uniref:Uncharacterized protein n=1 Tax=Belnapia rosea TaxID=938405 RepID=A0A1G7DFR4_9PROT|nr:hypothetical protein [Belnapia rosea]SDE50372.1 hypothetical protein SAMN04487779_10453 [Belnapia rosea]
MISTDTTALIAAVLADLPPDEQTGLMVLTMTAYIQTAREAGMTEADIEISLRVLCGTRTKKEAAMRPPAWFQ